jgi:hypothetical protein
MTIATTRPPRRSFVHPAVARIARVLLPLAVVAGVLALLIGPAAMNCFCSSKEDVARATAKKYAYEAYVQWTMVTGLACPAHLAHLNQFMNNRDTRDPWGTEYLMRCGEHLGPNQSTGIVVGSAGPDRRFGSEDDIGSDRWSRK